MHSFFAHLTLVIHSASSIIKYTKCSVRSIYYSIFGIISKSKIRDGREIPIIINNFNRLTTLLQLIDALTSRNYHNIYIIDNNSTYPPLLEYYKECPYTVFRLNENLGFKALWKSGLNKKFCHDYYIYTDSDVVPADFCPDDFICYFFKQLKTHPLTQKIGFSLRIDNLPDYYKNKSKVIDWEQRFYLKSKNGLYRAPIDTTFALYRPHIGLSRSRYVESYRTAYPYQAEHIPWYTDSENISEEEKYYISHCKQTTGWTAKMQQEIHPLLTYKTSPNK